MLLPRVRVLPLPLDLGGHVAEAGQLGLRPLVRLLRLTLGFRGLFLGPLFPGLERGTTLGLLEGLGPRLLLELLEELLLLLLILMET